MQRMFLLEGSIQHYTWGGYSFLPQLMGRENDGHQPFSEYWLGTHPLMESRVHTKNGVNSLINLIKANKEEVLGEACAKQFGALPFLLKILDVRQMLSIQVHPDQQQAMEGFERENKEGIQLSAPNRNYKDANHKPEMLVALSDFWLLHGFKPTEELNRTFETVPEFSSLKSYFFDGGYKTLYSHVMEMEQGQVNDLLTPLRERIMEPYTSGELTRDNADFWAARAMDTYTKKGDFDRGIFSIYFFNLVHLKKGEGLFQGAGLPHAYLEGQCVELMANSDNVLRAGLTDKHIDVAELLRLVKYQETYPSIIKQEKGERSVYPAPVPEFQLQQYNLLKGEQTDIELSPASELLMIQGEVILRTGGEELTLVKGGAAFIIANTQLQAEAAIDCKFFIATVP